MKVEREAPPSGLEISVRALGQLGYVWEEGAGERWGATPKVR